LEPGTRVFVEGPYGAFRIDRRTSDHLVLIGAGIGITPLRALLDELPSNGQADVIYRVHGASAPLADELERIEQHSNGRVRVHVLAGTRQQHPMNVATLRRLVPDIAGADVYTCGPTAFIEDVARAATALGVPAESIHHELFEF